MRSRSATTRARLQPETRGRGHHESAQGERVAAPLHAWEGCSGGRLASREDPKMFRSACDGSGCVRSSAAPHSRVRFIAPRAHAGVAACPRSGQRSSIELESLPLGGRRLRGTLGMHPKAADGLAKRHARVARSAARRLASTAHRCRQHRLRQHRCSRSRHRRTRDKHRLGCRQRGLAAWASASQPGGSQHCQARQLLLRSVQTTSSARRSWERNEP
jgi:hypothetical protein